VIEIFRSFHFAVNVFFLFGVGGFGGGVVWGGFWGGGGLFGGVGDFPLAREVFDRYGRLFFLVFRPPG